MLGWYFDAEALDEALERGVEDVGALLHEAAVGAGGVDVLPVGNRRLEPVLEVRHAPQKSLRTHGREHTGENIFNLAFVGIEPRLNWDYTALIYSGV